jgi:hypothetical protein
MVLRPGINRTPACGRARHGRTCAASRIEESFAFLIRVILQRGGDHEKVNRTIEIIFRLLL